MVGITGWIDFSQPASAAENILSSMAAGLGNGLGGATTIRADEHAGLALCAHQKMASTYFGDRMWAVVHGYPQWREQRFAEMARELGTARVVAEAYREIGRDILQKIGGPCSLAVIDREERTALVAIDRVGIETMCYATPRPGALVFGSRTNAVRAHPAVSSTLSHQAVFNYMQRYVVRAPLTIFKEQSKLYRAHCVELKNGKIDVAPYWDITYQSEGPADSDALARDTRLALRNGVARAIEDEDIGRVGAYLSGGLDSSTVSGFLKEVGGRSRTFTIGFDVPDYDETEYAQMAADRFRTEHSEIFVTPDDALNLIPKMGKVYDEPFGNASLVPSFYCAKRAQEQGVDLMLAGDGGDELFGGNMHYTEMLRIQTYERLPRLLRSAFIEPLALKVPGLDKIPPVGKARRWIEQYQVPMPDRLTEFGIVAGWTAESIFDSDWLGAIDPQGDQQFQQEAYFGAKSPAMLQRMLHLDLQVVLADNDLRKVTRMCELAGIRVRYPMLDEEVVEVSGRIPPDVMIPGLKLRHFYKQTMRDFLPSEIINKKKHGFVMPTIVWLMDDGPFRDYVMEGLSSCRKRGIFDRSFMDEVINHRSHDDAFELGSLAWDILSLELWLQGHVDPLSETSATHGREAGIRS